MAGDLDLARMLQEGVSTGDILKELPPPARPLGKGERLQRAWQGPDVLPAQPAAAWLEALPHPTGPGKGERMERFRDQQLDAIDAKILRDYARPWWGETRVPAKDSKLADLGRTALGALAGARIGMGYHGGLGRPFGGRASEMLNSEPSRLHVEGGLGMFETPLTPGATQPDRILGRAVVPPLALTNRDTSSMSDSDLADKIYDKVRVNEYPLRAQWAKIVNDLKDRPFHHAWNSARQVPMAMGYTGAAEGAAALGLLKYLPLLARAEEAPIPGSILDRPAYSRLARPGER